MNNYIDLFHTCKPSCCNNVHLCTLKLEKFANFSGCMQVVRTLEMLNTELLSEAEGFNIPWKCVKQSNYKDLSSNSQISFTEKKLFSSFQGYEDIFILSGILLQGST